MSEAATPAGYLHEDVVLMLCDVETTGLDPERDHVIELAVVFARWPSLEVVQLPGKVAPLVSAEKEWLVQAPDECFEEASRGGVRWKASQRGAGRLHQILPERVCSYEMWERYYLRPMQDAVSASAPEMDVLYALRNGGPISSAEVAIELCDLTAQVKRGSRARKIIVTSDNSVFETAHIKALLKKADERWPFHYCSWDTTMLLDATGVGDPNNPPHRAMADTQALLGQLRAAMTHVRWAQGFAPGPTGELVSQPIPERIWGRVGETYTTTVCQGPCRRQEPALSQFAWGSEALGNMLRAKGWEHFPLRGWVCGDCKEAVREHEADEAVRGGV